MGLVHTEITLKNVKDMLNAEDGLIPEQEVREMTVTSLVDTGAWTLVINEATRDKLGLRFSGKSPSVLSDTSTLANGEKDDYDMAGPVEVKWKDRRVICEALILPNADDILLGAIPLEAMDLTINPKRELIGKHGDQIMHKIY